jgi:hypothetical protein
LWPPFEFYLLIINSFFSNIIYPPPLYINLTCLSTTVFPPPPKSTCCCSKCFISVKLITCWLFSWRRISSSCKWCSLCSSKDFNLVTSSCKNGWVSDRYLMLNEPFKYFTNPLNWIFIELDHWNNYSWVDISLHTNTLSYSEPISLCSYSLMLRAYQSSRKYQFYSLWFDQPRLEPTIYHNGGMYPLHHRCGFL